MNTIMTKGTMIRVLQLTVVTALSLCVGLSQVSADDTEVFFPVNLVDPNDVANPNLLFMIDTSGSMACSKTVNVNGSCPDESDPLSRMDRLKAALIQVLNELPSNVNIGLGRYSGQEGAAILFPVTAINTGLRVFTGVVQSNTNSYTTVGAGSEAEELIPDTASATPSPNARNVTLVNNLSPKQIRVGTLTPFNSAGGPGPPVRTDLPAIRINDFLNEAEQWNNGTVETGTISNRRCGVTTNSSSTKGFIEMLSNPLTYTNGGTADGCRVATAGTPGKQIIGLRFTNVNVPAGATIVSARLKFTVVTQNPNDQTVDYRIRGELAASSVAFATSQTANFFNNRTRSSDAASVTGSLDTNDTATGGNPPNGGTITLADVTSIANAIKSTPGWIPGNPMTFFISDNGTYTNNLQRRNRLLHSFLTGGSGFAPSLEISYDAPTTVPPSGYLDKNLTALRFDEVPVPRGARIVSATLEMRAEGAQTMSPAVRVNITGEKAGNSAVYQQAVADLSSRTDTTASVAWTLPASVANNASIISTDISTVIREITDDAAWCGSNALTLFLDGSPTTVNSGATAANQFKAYARNGTTSSGDGPILHIELDLDDTALINGCNVVTTANTVTNNNDDGEEQRAGSTGDVSLTGDDLELGFDSDRQLIAMRFTDVKVPRNAVIESAKIIFTAKSAHTAAAGLRVFAENSGDAAPLGSSNSALSGRAATATAKVDWDTTGGTLTNWVVNETYSTPDLDTVVQAVVNRGDWLVGNDMLFFVEANCGGSTSCTRRAFSRDGGTSKAPALQIRYRGSALGVTVRDELKRLVRDLPTKGGTPTVPAYWEAARYLRGEGACYGRTRGEGDNVGSTDCNDAGGTPDGDKPLHRISHVKTFSTTPTLSRDAACTDQDPNNALCETEIWTGTTTYKSPITKKCGSNSIVLFTDGQPTVNDAKTLVRNMIVPTLPSCATSTTQPGAGDCAKELAIYLSTKDQAAGVDGDQMITTHTIGMNLPANVSPNLCTNGTEDGCSTAWLQEIATAGGGSFYDADSASSIVAAFRSIISSILDIDTTFVAPAVTVNTFNRLTNRDELYFALFQPNNKTKWQGNLKKYKLKQFSGITKIAGADDMEAVDTSTGFFKDSSISVWSSAVDGSDVSKGGVIDRLDASAPRKAYTYTGANLPPATTPSPVDITEDIHHLESDNSAITNSMAGVPVADPPNATADAAALKDVLDWAYGIDLDDVDADGFRDDARRALGDPLHSQPLLASYKGTNDADTTNDDITLFYGDNEGALRAVDTGTGNEIFTFTPKELLKNLYTFRKNQGTYLDRPYGLDGPITRLFNDANKNLILQNTDGSVETGEFLYLYVGMRRGGKNYYSLDVSGRGGAGEQKPKLRWVIYGGVAGGDYAELGQTWSDAVVRKIKYKGEVKDVIIFSGGYDPDQDGSIPLTDATDQGRAVYIADAVTGERLWWASLSGANLNLPLMKFSIPASPKVVDLDADGIADRIYVADTGGQIFRIVLNTNHAVGDAASTLATGSRIAMLSDADTAAGSRTAPNARRFFAPPDVAVLDQGGGKKFLSISIGSGYREKPNNKTIEDRFYVLRDPDEQKGPVNPLSIIESGTIPSPNPTGVATLFDATANLIGQGTTAEKNAAQVSLDSSAGFFIKMNTGGSFVGEKVFTESLTVGGNIIFASFTPSSVISACKADFGLSRLYLISALNGTPVVDYSTPGANPASCSGTACDRADRSINLNVQGLPADPAIIFPGVGGGIVCVGSDCNPAQFVNAVGKVHWLKKSD